MRTDGDTIRLCVLQLGSGADVLRSLMGLRAAKQLYPKLEITFVAHQAHAALLSRVPWIASTHVIEMTNDLDIKKLARWVSPLVQEYWDIVLNWTFSDASSYLTALLPARVKLGMTRRRDPNTPISCPDGWTQFVQGVVQQGIPQNIHLTDVLTTQLLTALQIHLGDPTPDSSESSAASVSSRGFFKLDLQPWRQSARRWLAIWMSAPQGSSVIESDPAVMGAFVHELIEHHPDWGVVLLGDHARARAVVEHLLELGHEESVVLNLSSQTGFDLTASVISQSQWLIANDPFALNLASVVGTRVMSIARRESELSQTGPYGNGHYVICPLDFDAASADRNGQPNEHALYGAWLYAQEEWSHRRQITASAFLEKRLMGHAPTLAAIRSVALYRSRIRDTESGGGVVYETQTQTPLSLASWLASAYGHVARAWYCGWVPKIGLELHRAALAPALIRELRALDQGAEVLEKLLGECVTTAGALERVATRLRSDRLMSVSERSQIAQQSERLTELEGLIERTLKTVPALRGVGTMLRVMMHNLPGTQLGEIAESSTLSYQQCQQGVSIVRQWIRHTLTLTRPVAIPSDPPIESPALSKL